MEPIEKDRLWEGFAIDSDVVEPAVECLCPGADMACADDEICVVLDRRVISFSVQVPDSFGSAAVDISAEAVRLPESVDDRHVVPFAVGKGHGTPPAMPLRVGLAL